MRATVKNNTQQFPLLETVTRPTLDTAAAAYYLNLRPQTLRAWASCKKGPIHPLHIGGRLAWKVSDVKKLTECGSWNGRRIRLTADERYEREARTRLMQVLWRVENREKRSLYEALWKKDNRELVRAYALKGLDLSDVKLGRMLTRDDKLVAIELAKIDRDVMRKDDKLELSNARRVARELRHRAERESKVIANKHARQLRARSYVPMPCASFVVSIKPTEEKRSERNEN